jgi:hypothetical protein
MVDDPNTEVFVHNMIDKYSTGYRTYKNTLMFLMADPNEFEGFRRGVRRFLALNAIKMDKETMKRLTEEDRDRVDERLEKANSSISLKILSFYRHMSKASKDGVKKFDLGIPTIERGLTLSRRVRDCLKDQDIMLERVSPRVLLERAFAKEDDRKSVAEVWEAFLKFPELPILEDGHVLRNAVAQGVGDGTFGLLVGDKVRYAEPILAADVSEEAFILRRDIAQKMKVEAGEVPIGIGTTPAEIRGGPQVSVRAPEGLVRRYALRASVPWDKLSDLLRGVLTPLRSEDAQISLEVKIEAQSEKGISRNTLDLKIKETLTQIGAKVLEEKEE